jgi:hypothetical protein
MSHPTVQVVPVCESCGLLAMFEARGEDLFAPRTVVCSCGWTGTMPSFVRLDLPNTGALAHTSGHSE